MSLGKKTLVFAHWLYSLLICAAFFAFLFAPDFVRGVYDGLEASLGGFRARILFGVLLAIYAALSVALACVLFRRAKKTAGRAERGFIDVASGDSGRVRIAVAAIEQMVRQSVHSIDGISEMKIDIENLDDAIGINVNAVIVSGSHVPTLTANMQRAIRQFVELNCGVAVRDIAISINAVTSAESGRRLFGRARADAVRRAAPREETGVTNDGPAQTLTPTEAPVEEPQVPSVCEETTEVDKIGFDSPEAESTEQTEVYDVDRPYESQFAKDLAELKAREAESAGAEETDAR